MNNVQYLRSINEKYSPKIVILLKSTIELLPQVDKFTLSDIIIKNNF